ncbi:MAG: hypothetical protein K6C11_00525 [Bacilli bacterium]|nr:hypothetical protein [Bacilli bacterium]
MINIMHKVKEARPFRKSQEYIDYDNTKDRLKKDKKSCEKYIDQYKQRLERLLEDKTLYNEKAYNEIKEQIQRWKYEKEKCELERKFIRPNRKEEIEDRERIANTFGNNLLEVLGSESNLRFHGTPIYYAKQIIESGGISSTADRYDGYIKSTDLPGTFSASTINTLSRSINFFTDFGSYIRCLPCGVLFVLREQEGDYELRGESSMQNINFKEKPDNLVAIVCTDEVKNKVIRWCNKNEIDSNKVFTYDGFIEYARNNNLEKGRSL